MRTVVKLAIGSGINAAVEVIRTWLPPVLILVATTVAYHHQSAATVVDSAVITGYLAMVGLCILCSLIGGLVGVYASHDPDTSGPAAAHVGAVIGLVGGGIVLLLP